MSRGLGVCEFLTGGLGPQSMFFDKKVLSSSLGLCLPWGHCAITSLSTSCSSRGRSSCQRGCEGVRV